ncbi:MAG: Ig-like domain-containing protein [Candidatus Thermoplasmatota archaeon]|nr:Ig-like domain-containing protein [Candidatus Thermoplasmatota archaeon]
MITMKTINRMMRILLGFGFVIFCFETNVQADSFNDDFSTDTTTDYTVMDTWTLGGNGQFLYNAIGESAQVLTGDDIGLKFSHTIPASESGIFTIDFYPTQKYPYGGVVYLRLLQDADNYYELSNTDGYGSYCLKKFVNGVHVDNANFQNEYTQNHPYQLTIHFSSDLTTVEAFDELIFINSESSSIMVSGFEIETRQQDAYYDNIFYSNRECDLNEDCSFFDDACNLGVCIIDSNDHSTCAKDPSSKNDDPCNDSNACTHTDICSDGICSGTTYNCDDGNVCTDDTCNGDGTCSYVNNNAVCDDGNFCTHTDTCSGGICSGTHYSCNDSNVCTNDICNGDGTCSYVNNTNDCDDEIDCTTDDVCNGGECHGLPNDALCDDGLFCNGIEYCDAEHHGCKSPGNPCPWLCDEDNDTCLIPSPLPLPSCYVSISPSMDIVTAGDSIEFTAVTTCDGVEVKGNYEWEITTTIGSSIDENTGLYTAGGDKGTDTIVAKDIDNFNVSATAVVDVMPQEEPTPPPVCDTTIDPCPVSVYGGETITLTATIPDGEGCLEPDYTWHIDTDIHSKITASGSSCFYEAGNNKTGILLTDRIIVIDNANGTETEAMITVEYGRIVAVFPDVILSSRCVPLPYLMIILGENTRFNGTSYASFSPDDSITVIGQIGYGNLMIVMVLVPPNTEENLVDVSATTINGNGEIVTFDKQNIFDINLLKFTQN